jgi:SMP-30/Gluconolactonase/LRE-like region
MNFFHRVCDRCRLVQATIGFAVLCWAPIAVDSATAEATAAARASLERIQVLRKERPNDGILAFYEALVDISLGESAAAFDLLRSLQGRRLGLIPVRDIGFETVWEDPEFQAIRKRLIDEEAQTPTSPMAFRLTDPKLIPEGIAYDPKSERFFIGSIAERKIVITDAKGQARDFSSPSDKLDPILGLRVDVARRALYAVSSNGFKENAKTERRNAIVQYDLKSGRLTNRFLAPEASQLNDLVVASDGTLYVTDSMGDTLFRRKPNEKALSRFGQRGAVRGVNGIALSSNGSLYVALSTGIARVDIATGKPTKLPQPDTVVTGGCDGLYWHDGDLIGVQNSTNPGRVIRIALTDNGNRIAGLTVLQSHHHPDFNEPTTGAIANGALNVIGNSYVGHYQPDGLIKDSAPLKGTAIIAVPLRR